MTKLEKLMAAYDALDAYADAARGAAYDAWDAYQDELKRIQEENPND